jgi:hypothetical protein
MKSILLIPVLLALVACNSEKSETTTVKTQNLFKEGTVLVSSYRNAGDNRSTSEQAKEMLTIQKELEENNITVNIPNTNYPTWQSYKILLETMQQKISGATLHYSKIRMLEMYRIYEQGSDATAIAFVKPVLKKMIAEKYTGFTNLYQYLSWLKKNNEHEFVKQLKPVIMEYAKPAFEPGKQTAIKNTAIENNPAFQAEISKMVARVKENDASIEKIRVL